MDQLQLDLYAPRLEAVAGHLVGQHHVPQPVGKLPAHDVAVRRELLLLCWGGVGAKGGGRVSVPSFYFFFISATIQTPLLLLFVWWTGDSTLAASTR
jgi:hypothetical protein